MRDTLIVDDDVEWATAKREHLQSIGVRWIDLASTTLAAEALLREHQYRCIVVDVNLGHLAPISGDKWILKSQDLFGDAKLVVLTANKRSITVASQLTERRVEQIQKGTHKERRFLRDIAAACVAGAAALPIQVPTPKVPVPHQVRVDPPRSGFASCGPPSFGGVGPGLVPDNTLHIDATRVARLSAAPTDAPRWSARTVTSVTIAASFTAIAALVVSTTLSDVIARVLVTAAAATCVVVLGLAVHLHDHSKRVRPVLVLAFLILVIEFALVLG